MKLELELFPVADGLGLKAVRIPAPINPGSQIRRIGIASVLVDGRSRKSRGIYLERGAEAWVCSRAFARHHFHNGAPIPRGITIFFCP